METAATFAMAFLVSALVSIWEIVFVRYKRRSAFVKGSPYVYIYSIIFGVVSIAILYGVQNNLFGEIPIDSKLILGNAYLAALTVGFFTRPLLDVNLFNLSAGGKKIPIGIKTFTTFFEEPLLEKIENDHFENTTRFIDAIMLQYPTATVQGINNMVVNGLKTFEDTNRALTFLTGPFNTATTTREQFILVLREFGKDVFCTVFNCPN